MRTGRRRGWAASLQTWRTCLRNAGANRWAASACVCAHFASGADSIPIFSDRRLDFAKCCSSWAHNDRKALTLRWTHVFNATAQETAEALQFRFRVVFPRRAGPGLWR
jgi:hypothetical protein